MELAQCTDQWISKEDVIEKYNKYKNMLFNIAYSYLGNKYDCEDILQEAFIKLCYHAPEFEAEENEKRWIIRITINLCKNQIKSYWNKKKVPIEDLDELSYHEDIKKVMTEIAQLPEKYKSSILLYYIVGYRVSEIADILHISESAVKMRLKRGRDLLKIEMED
jgi:RNA polymerase sigma-70 factor (ECF subfamily)